MPRGPRAPREGKPVKRQPSAFPFFCDGRKPSVVTADPWAFLRHLATTKLRHGKETEALVSPIGIKEPGMIGLMEPAFR